MISNGRAGSSPARGTLKKWEIESGKWEVKYKSWLRGMWSMKPLHLKQLNPNTKICRKQYLFLKPSFQFFVNHFSEITFSLRKTINCNKTARITTAMAPMALSHNQPISVIRYMEITMTSPASAAQKTALPPTLFR